MRALRFRPSAPAEPLAPSALPPQPGGEVWCDLERHELTEPAAGAPRAWLEHLHPLTAGRLRQEVPETMAAAQQDYLHVRVCFTPASPEAPEGGRLDVVDLVLGHGFALTVRTGEPARFGDLWQQFAQGRRRADGVDFAVYQVLAQGVGGYRAATEGLVTATERLVERLTDHRQRHVLGDIVHLRRRAARLRAVLAPAVDALSLLAAGGRADVVRGESRAFYEDLREEVRTLLRTVESARDTMTEAVEAYTSVQSTEMNRVMQIFTVVAVVFAPPTLIASIYGMNFRIPEYRWPWGYAWALGLMGTVVTVMVVWMRRKHWL